MVRYDPYTDSFIDNPTKETTATINLDAFPKSIIQMNVVEVSDASIEKIADAVVRKLTDRKTEPISHDDYVETENDHLKARCLNCNNAKACKEKHWEGCVYEPKDEKTCESCRHWKYIAREWQCETTKCQGYTPKTEPNSSEKPNNCEDDEYWKHLFIEVAEGRMSDAGANQAWYEYINHKDEPQTYITEDRDTQILDAWQVYHRSTTSVEDEPQTETEIAKAIVHKMIDDAVIAEDAYPDLRQKMHDAVERLDEYYPSEDERSE